MQQDTHRIPRNLDRPVPILMWDPVEFIVALMLFGIGVVMKMLIVGFVFTIAILFYSSKVKRRGKRGMALHFMWRMGYLLDKPLRDHAPHPTNVDFTR